MRTQHTRALDELEKSIQDTIKRGYSPKYIKNHWSIMVNLILSKIEKESKK